MKRGGSIADLAGTLLIAEVAQAHDGSLGMAHAFIDAAASAGIDAIKFQTHIAACESTPDEPWRIKFSPQDLSRYDYWRRMEFTEEQWQGLKRHADDAGLYFLSSPFSVEAVDLLTRVGVSGWKIASGEVTNAQMFDRMAGTGLPVLLSTGMSSWNEIDRAVRMVRERGLELIVFQCTSRYPTSAEDLGLNVIQELRERFHCRTGLSDHTGTIYAGLAAVALGAEALEVHITLSRDMFGPDVPVSLTPAEIAELVRGVRFIEKALANPVDKDDMALQLTDMRQLFTKSIVARRALQAGHCLSADDLTLKKPGTGLPSERLSTLIGRRLARSLNSDQVLTEADLEAE